MPNKSDFGNKNPYQFELYELVPDEWGFGESDGEESDGEEYEVAEIMADRLGSDGMREYWVRWVGYDSEEDYSWLSKDALENSPKLLAEYRTANGGPAKRPKQSALVKGLYVQVDEKGEVNWLCQGDVRLGKPVCRELSGAVRQGKVKQFVYYGLGSGQGAGVIAAYEIRYDDSALEPEVLTMAETDAAIKLAASTRRGRNRS